MERKPILKNVDSFINAAKDVQMNMQNANVQTKEEVKENVNVDVDKNADKNADVSANVFVIKKAEKYEDPQRYTFWLKPSTVKKIKTLAKDADKKISPFFQEFLDNILDKIEIK